MDTIVEQDVFNKLKEGDVVLTKQEQKVQLISYLGDGSWYACLAEDNTYDGVIFNDQILTVLSSNNE